MDVVKQASGEGEGVQAFDDDVGGRNNQEQRQEELQQQQQFSVLGNEEKSASARSSFQDGRAASQGDEHLAGVRRTELVWDRRNSDRSVPNMGSEGLEAVSRGVEFSTSWGHKRFDVDSDVQGENIERDGPGLFGGTSEESIINSSGIGLGVSGSCSLVEGKATGGHNASASFVNPRDAFGMEGEGDAEAEHVSQRRLTFDNGDKNDDQRGTASQV